MMPAVPDDDKVLRDLGETLDKPSAARVYDYFLGGNHHYAIDQRFGEKIMARLPLLPQSALTFRQFLGRAVRHCAQAGITQFVDIGSGLPTQGNVHEVADEARPKRDCRVVYIDNEPIALLHSEILLAKTADENRHKAIAADLLNSSDLWDRVLRTRIIDPARPIALVVNAVLHFFKDEQNPGAALEFYRKQVAPGSMLVLSQLTDENPRDDDERQALRDLERYYEDTTNPGQMRDSAAFTRFFGDWDLVEPGLVYAPAWHPEENTVMADSPSKSRVIAGVARKNPS
jgi:O-methyltransferase involved in polyketide biosynthesis